MQRQALNIEAWKEIFNLHNIILSSSKESPYCTIEHILILLGPVLEVHSKAIFTFACLKVKQRKLSIQRKPLSCVRRSQEHEEEGSTEQNFLCAGTENFNYNSASRSLRAGPH